jgi:hypothetical protein
LATSGISILLLALLPALLALFPPLLPCLPVLLALLPALLALFLALLTIRGPVLVLPTTATLAIALASGSVSAFVVPAWLVASVSPVSPAHEFLLVVVDSSIQQRKLYPIGHGRNPGWHIRIRRCGSSVVSG